MGLLDPAHDRERRFRDGVRAGIVLAMDLAGDRADIQGIRLRLEAGVDGAAELADGVAPRFRSAAARLVLRELCRREEPIRSRAFDQGLHVGASLGLAAADDSHDADEVRAELDRIEDIAATLCGGRLAVAADGLVGTFRRELDRRRLDLEIALATEWFGD
jgi:hypothetical protein